MTQWATRRRFVYGAAVVFALVLVWVYMFRGVLFPQVNCFDQKQNGYETGVDCGGICDLRCSQEIIPLSVSWTQIIPLSSTTYDFAALISNKNVDNAPRGVSYTFIVYGVDGKELITLNGVTTVPVDGDFPIIVQNVSLPRKPAQLQVALDGKVLHYKVLEKPTVPTIRVSNTTYEAGSIPRVYATITNTKQIILKNIPVKAVLYDIDGNAFAVGQTIIPVLDKEESENIVFTWDKPLPYSPTKIRIFPILDPFLGS